MCPHWGWKREPHWPTMPCDEARPGWGAPPSSPALPHCCHSQVAPFSGTVTSIAMSHCHGMFVSAPTLVLPDQTYWPWRQLAMEPWALLTFKTWHSQWGISIIDLQAAYHITGRASCGGPSPYSSAPLSLFVPSSAYPGDSFLGPGDLLLHNPPNLF